MAWLSSDGYVRVSDNARSGGGTYAGQKWRIVFHSTEFDVDTLPALVSVARRHFAPPHTWYRPANRLKVQTVPLNRSAFALARRSGDPQTNKANALQVELVGFAGRLHELTDRELKNIAEDVVVPFVRYVRSLGQDVDLSFHGTPGPAEGRYGLNASTRMGWANWFSFNGMTAHYGVPGQTHWDTGTLNTHKIIQYTKIALGEGDTMTQQEYDALYKNVSNTREWLKPKLDKVMADLAVVKARPTYDGTVEVVLDDTQLDKLAEELTVRILAHFRNALN